MERVRVTVSMDPEVLAVFERMAEASGLSVSRCIGDWLGDTAEAAQLAAEKMQQIRRTPMTAARAHMRYMGALATEAVEVMRAAPASAARRGTGAPSSNTGLKSPRKG